MNFVLLLLITSPVLSAASLLRVTISSFSITNRPSISTSSAYVIYSLVLLKIVPFGLVSILLITFPRTILNSAVDSESPCLQPLSMPNTAVSFPWISFFFFPFFPLPPPPPLFLVGNPATSFLLISLISLGPQVLLKFSINMFHLLSHRPA